MSDEQLGGDAIAIVGMAGRFGEAPDLAAFWQNLVRGESAVRRFTDEELLAAGAPRARLSDPSYVPYGVVMPDMEGFDAGLFGFSPRDAALLDPQHRHFFEVAWAALDDAGYDPGRFDGAIGVFAGSGHNAYLPYNLLTNPAVVQKVGFFLLRHTGNDKDFLPTRLSYCLNLRGPSVAVQTACSTSLVAVHLAVQSLLAGECDMALAGGCTIELPHRQGYVFREGEILSPDGKCRPFDAKAQGTVFGSGAGVVVLRRLADALDDGDVIHAVLRATAVNNDGSQKVGYLAPSVDGQAAGVAEALSMAAVPVESIGLLEAHGTGTAVGDPIEVSALTQAFRKFTPRKGFCALSSVKANIGHTDTAAGVAGLLKAVLALKHHTLPPTLHFEAPSPVLDLPATPFFVSAEAAPWPAPAGGVRRAGVNSLGVGGTNAHAIVEEAPARGPSPPSRPSQLLVLSARSAKAAEEAQRRLGARLAAEALPLADVAFTLAEGRRSFSHRRAVVVREGEDVAALLQGDGAGRVLVGEAKGRAPGVAFLFPGGGAQYPRMGAGLLEACPVYREELERCLRLAEAKSGIALRALLDDPAAGEALARPTRALPTLFATSYALAKQWMAWGIRPAALLGHSLGEYVAAALAGVFSLEDALALVVLRGQLFETTEPGGMISVAASPEGLAPHITGGVSLAAHNAAELSVLAGPVEALRRVEAALVAAGVEVKPVPIDVAAHSSLLEPILPAFRELTGRIAYKAPQIPFVSNVTGRWITAEEATSPDYWVRHLRSTVRFHDALTTLLEGDAALLEVGPGRTLGGFARAHGACGPTRAVAASLRHPKDDTDDLTFLLGVLGRLWVAGVEPSWRALFDGEGRRRVALPSYPFEHTRYWIEPGTVAPLPPEPPDARAKRPRLDDWFSVPVFRPTPPRLPVATTGTWLLLAVSGSVGAPLAAALAAGGHKVLTAQPGAAFRASPGGFTFRLTEAEDHEAMLLEATRGGPLAGVVYLDTARRSATARELDAALDASFFGLLAAAQALGRGEATVRRLVVVTAGVCSVAGEAAVSPLGALALGPVHVLPTELPEVSTSLVDLPAGDPVAAPVLDALVRELPPSPATVVALRGGARLVRAFESWPLPPTAPAPLPPEAVVLVTGGLRGIGLAVAEHLGRRGARLVLVSREGMPPREAWASLAATSELARTARALEGLEAAGVAYDIVRADVTTPEGARGAVARAKERWGAVHAVVHGAGVLDDGLIQLKGAASARRVLAPKVQGTLALAEAVRGEPLQWMLLFSSVSAFVGLPGQVDYAAANAFLDAFAEAEHGAGGLPCVSVAWNAWRDVGMAARLAASLGVPDDGPELPPGRPTAHPLLERCIDEQPAARVYATLVGPGRTWLLGEHRLRGGDALVPGTGFLEMMRAALEETGARGPMLLTDVAFGAALAVADDDLRELRVAARSLGHAMRLSVTSRGESGEETLHAEGTARIGPAAPPPVDLGAIARRCTVRDEVYRGPESEVHLRFGPRWSCLRRVRYGVGEALLDLELPRAFAEDEGVYKLHPAVLDMATGGAPGLLGADGREALRVPQGYDALTQWGPLAGPLQSHVRLVATDGATARFDVTVCDGRGAVRLEVRGFTLRRVGDRGQLRAPARGAGVAARPSNTLLERSLAEGIGTAEGVEALERALAAPRVAHVVISSQSLEALRPPPAEAADDGAEPGQGAEPARGEGAPRPHLPTPYVAPRTALESTIAGLWRESLGLAEIGVHDDFFDLGGHSLLLTQLVARVRKLTGCDLPLRALFEKRTVASLAEEIGAARASEPGDAPVALGGPPLRRVERERYRVKRATLPWPDDERAP